MPEKKHAEKVRDEIHTTINTEVMQSVKLGFSPMELRSPAQYNLDTYLGSWQVYITLLGLKPSHAVRETRRKLRQASKSTDIDILSRITSLSLSLDKLPDCSTLSVYKACQ